MAFTPRTETYVNVSSLTTPFNITVTKPTGTVDGDILFCWIGWYAAVTIDSVPSGWNLLGQYIANTDRYALYYKIAAGEPANWVWSFTATAKVRAVCSCYTGGDFDPADPIDVVSNTAYRTSDTNCRAASMVVAAANSPLVFWGGVYSTASKTFTKPSIPTIGWVEDDDAGSTTPDFWTEVCSFIWSGSGATGIMSATISALLATKHAFAVALNPPGAPPQTISGAGNIASGEALGNPTIIIGDIGGDDPSVDKQIAAGGDDGLVYWGAFYGSLANVYQGIDSDNQEWESWYRWIGVTLEGTITVAYIQCYADEVAGTAELLVYGVDEDNPPAPTTYAQYYADPLTTASVPWDGTWTLNAWNQSPSLVGIFQELVDTYTIDNDAVMVQIRNDHAAVGADHYNRCRSWEYAGNLHGAKLHIEYTAGAAPQTITGAGGIGSQEAFGVAMVALTLFAGSIASGEAFGTPNVGAQTISPAGIVSQETWGTPDIELTIAPSGIASGEVFEQPTMAFVVRPTGISGAEAFGQPALTFLVEPDGVASQEAFGSPKLNLSVGPSGIASGEAFGTPRITLYLSPSGVASGETFGTPTVSLTGPSQTIVPVGIASAEAFGTAKLTIYIGPSGIASQEAFGQPALALVVRPGGIASAEGFGTPTILPEAVTIRPSGITSKESFGLTRVMGGLPPPPTPPRCVVEWRHSWEVSESGREEDG